MSRSCNMTVTEKSLMMVYILFSLYKNMFPGLNYLMLLEVTKYPPWLLRRSQLTWVSKKDKPPWKQSIWKQTKSVLLLPKYSFHWKSTFKNVALCPMTKQMLKNMQRMMKIRCWVRHCDWRAWLDKTWEVHQEQWEYHIQLWKLLFIKRDGRVK